MTAQKLTKAPCDAQVSTSICIFLRPALELMISPIHASTSSRTTPFSTSRSAFSESCSIACTCSTYPRIIATPDSCSWRFMVGLMGAETEAGGRDGERRCCSRGERNAADRGLSRAGGRLAGETVRT